MNSRPQARRVSQSPPCDVSLPCQRNFRPLSASAAHPSKFRTFFQVAYTLSPLPATLTKTTGVYTDNSRSGTHGMRLSIANIALTPLTATLMSLSASVANKRLKARPTPLGATLTKNRGEGSPLWLTTHPIRTVTRLPRAKVDPSHVRPRITGHISSSLFPPGCRPPFRMLRFGVP